MKQSKIIEMDMEQKSINKQVVDEIIDDIFVCSDGNIKIVFKYKNEYFEAMDFIKNNKCDIITTDVCASKFCVQKLDIDSNFI